MTPEQTLEMRALIRSLIAEAVPEQSQPEETRSVSVASDADLAALVGTLVEILDDPVQGARLRAGRIGFTLRPATPGSSTASAPQASTPEPQVTGVLEIESGAVTEKVVTRAAAERLRLVLGPRAVLTPLARELVRRSGVQMERRTC